MVFFLLGLGLGPLELAFLLGAFGVVDLDLDLMDPERVCGGGS